MKYNLWTIEETLEKHIWIINSDEDFTSVDKIETLEEWCKIAIKEIMSAEWSLEEKTSICNRIKEILKKQKSTWSN